MEQIPSGDVLVINNTRVIKRRVYAGDLDILFLSEKENNLWEVLFPSKDFSLGDEIELPKGIKMKLIKKGRPPTCEAEFFFTRGVF